MTFILPSLDQQTRNAREAAGVEFMWHHIDTCHEYYLRDHHNRDGELMLGTFVDGQMTVKDVLDGLRDEFLTVARTFGEARAGYDHDKAEAALARMIAENESVWDKPFDDSLESWEESYDEYADATQAWFLLTWDVPDEDD